MTDKKTQGKKNRRSGAVFELKVRKDLESKGWIVDKWSNNVEFGYYDGCPLKFISREWKDLTLKNGKHYPGPCGRLIPAKRKYNPFNKALSIGVGFPDFIAFKKNLLAKRLMKSKGVDEFAEKTSYEVIGVESKSNGYLDKTEKEKCKWLLDNHIFSKVLIASKGKKRGEIIYTEYRKV